MIPEEGIDILGQAIEATLIKLIALNSITFISGAVFGFLAGIGDRKNDREKGNNQGRSRQGSQGRR